MDFYAIGRHLAKTAGFRMPSVARVGEGLRHAHDAAPGIQTLLGAAGGAVPGYYAGEKIDPDSTFSKGTMTALGAILGGQIGNPAYRRKMVGIGNPELAGKSWHDPSRKAILQSHIIKDLLGPKVAAGGLVFGSKMLSDWGSMSGSLKNTAANLDQTSADLKGGIADTRKQVGDIAKNVTATTSKAREDAARIGGNAAKITEDVAKHTGGAAGNIERATGSVADTADEIKKAQLGGAVRGTTDKLGNMADTSNRMSSAVTDASKTLANTGGRIADSIEGAAGLGRDAWNDVKKAAPWVGGGIGAGGLAYILANSGNKKKRREVGND